MSESRVRENLTHGLMRGKRAKPSNLLYIGKFDFAAAEKRTRVHRTHVR